MMPTFYRLLERGSDTRSLATIQMRLTSDRVCSALSCGNEFMPHAMKHQWFNVSWMQVKLGHGTSSCALFGLVTRGH